MGDYVFSITQRIIFLVQLLAVKRAIDNIFISFKNRYILSFSDQ